MMILCSIRYDPVELDQEVMCHMARENPQELANYSVLGTYTHTQHQLHIRGQRRVQDFS